MIIHIKYQGSSHKVVLINANVKTVTVLVRPFLSQGHNFNNLVEVYLQMLAIPNIKALYFELSGKNFCLCFPI